jgi:XRE family transcriptional regulator, regulator of sulfur utilization
MKVQNCSGCLGKLQNKSTHFYFFLKYILFMKLGNTIKELRKQKHIPQEVLAENCGITQAYLSQLENDKKEPNLATLKAISKGLDTPLPLIFFLSMTEDDISESKKGIFAQINPSIKDLVNTYI